MEQNEQDNETDMSELLLLQKQSDEELTRLKKALDRQLIDLKTAGLESPSDLARRFEMVQDELAKRRLTI